MLRGSVRCHRIWGFRKPVGWANRMVYPFRTAGGVAKQEDGNMNQKEKGIADAPGVGKDNQVVPESDGDASLSPSLPRNRQRVLVPGVAVEEGSQQDVGFSCSRSATCSDTKIE